jgi:hypothetical protein
MAAICSREFFLATAKVLMLAFAAVSAASAQTLTLSMPPGGSASFPVRISNPSSEPSSPLFIMDKLGYSSGFSLGTAPPCTLELHFNEDYWLRVASAPIAPGAGVDCTITVTRGQRDPDQNLAWTPQSDSTPQGAVLSPDLWRVGAYSDMQFSFEQIAPLPRRGETLAYFRAAARSRADFPIFGAKIVECIGGRDGYTLDGDFDGGCAQAQGLPEFICPPATIDVSWQLPTIPANGQSSCLIRMIAPNGIQAREIEGFVSFPGRSGDGFYVVDESNLDAILEFHVVVVDAPIPALKSFALWLLATLTALFGLLFIRRYPSRRGVAAVLSDND